MTKRLLALFLLWHSPPAALPQPAGYPFAHDLATLDAGMPELARRVIADYREADRETYLTNRFRLQLVGGDHPAALRALDSLRALRRATDPEGAGTTFFQYEIYCKAKLAASREARSFAETFPREFAGTFGALDDRTAFDLAGRLGYDLEAARARLEALLAERGAGSTIDPAGAIALVRAYQPYQVYRDILPLTEAALAADDRRRYAIEEELRIQTPEGATLSAVVVRPRRFTTPQPTALLFNIYSDPAIDLAVARQAAAHGFVGVVADARGKRSSPDPIEPYEHEVGDTWAVIDWISRQSWSDGQVGMFGGSYNGFAQWAATKRLHPALKTIVPVAAAIPGLGLPMHNNVFLNANYCWAFHVTNNKTLDQEVCRDSDRWDAMVEEWYASGRPYREIDRIDGTPNPLLQRWLAHPSYDRYWQAMVPFREDYRRIDIPVLTITGYFDDGQVSALHYLREHERYHPRANHVLLIGPYDHVGVQGRPAPLVRGYRVDPVAQIQPPEIAFQWLDHILRGGERPSLLRDRINFQVMGANEWRHVPSLDAAADRSLTLYLRSEPADGFHRLASSRPAGKRILVQEVDFADRTTTHGGFYPDSIVRTTLDPGNGLVFVSEPFEESFEINGAFSGVLEATINKRDVDVSVVLYELAAGGTYHHLSYFLGRASYAKDMTKRELLRPGVLESIPIVRTYMTSRRIERGSRLVVVVNVNKNPWAQINYGTGGDVSDESIEDAKTPLRIEWHDGSRVVIPIAHGAARGAGDGSSRRRSGPRRRRAANPGSGSGRQSPGRPSQP